MLPQLWLVLLVPIFSFCHLQSLYFPTPCHSCWCIVAFLSFNLALCSCCHHSHCALHCCWYHHHHCLLETFRDILIVLILPPSFGALALVLHPLIAETLTVTTGQQLLLRPSAMLLPPLSLSADTMMLPCPTSMLAIQCCGHQLIVTCCLKLSLFHYQFSFAVHLCHKWKEKVT